METNKHFSVIVVGENPEELLKKYDSNIKVEPYNVFEFSRAKEYKERYLSTLKQMIEKCEDEKIKLNLSMSYDTITHLSDTDYYLQLTEDYELDESTGNVISDKNPNGKFDSCRLGKNLCMPMYDKNGEEIFSALKSDIDWGRTHLSNQYTYEVVWDLVHEVRKPENEEEKTLYENMKNRKDYFNYFKNKENYILSNTAFWGYAFLDEKGWVELDDTTSQIEWINNFFDRFIKPLKENEKISIFECFRAL